MQNRIIYTTLLITLLLHTLFAYQISGIIVDQESGNNIPDAQVRVNDSLVTVDNGEFSFEVKSQGLLRLNISAPSYKEEVKSIYLNEKSDEFQFLSIVLTKRGDKKSDVAIVDRIETNGVSWKIQCHLIDTKYGLKMRFPGEATVKHNDNAPFKIFSSEFLIETKLKGTHTLHVEIPGFHPVTKMFTCGDETKELSLMLETTDTSNTVERREMIISGNRGTIHERTTPGKKSFTRKELSETAGTFDDPIRSLQTLPSVSTASDASAQMSVRGGDVLESRYFVDGIPLLQPFHFGGAISIFNEKAIHGLDFYNSGYPSRFHNAQSSVIDVTSRKPYLEDKNSQFIHISSLKYNFYRTQKMREGNKGFTMSANGTWLPLLFKPVSRLVQRIGTSDYDKYYRMLFNPVEYHGLTFGYGNEVNDKWRFNVNNIFNFDKFSFMEVDSPAVVEYTYSDGSKLKKTFTNTWDEEYDWIYNPPKPGFTDYRVVERVKSVDTTFHYKQYYNILYGTADYTANSENNLKLSAAWQKRWYDLKFPYHEHYKYKANSDILSLGGVWFNNSRNKHLLNGGVHFDFSYYDFDVFTMRPWHEVITRGNTNFGDMLGPFANDSGKTFGLQDTSMASFFDIKQRMQVRYKGEKFNFQGAFFIEDEVHINDRKSLTLGMRIEGSTADKELTFSPRVNYKQQVKEKGELSFSGGLYTQNNYQPDVIALTENLKPEKCAHFGVGYSHLFRDWLKVDADLYGKYYYDLSVELIDFDSIADDESLDLLDTNFTASSYYKNDGIGYAYGGELFIKYDPSSVLFGWFSLSYGHSQRQRQENWEWHAMPLERPFQFSWTHYYKLPRKYTVSCGYKITSGLPYADLTFSDDKRSMKIGPYNKKRYDFYRRFDIRLTRSFHKRNRKTEVYLDYINIFNRPNAFYVDSETKKVKTTALNAPFGAFTWGINMEF